MASDYLVQKARYSNGSTNFVTLIDHKKALIWIFLVLRCQVFRFPLYFIPLKCNLQKKTPRNSFWLIILMSRSLLMFSMVSSFIWYKSQVKSSVSSLGSPEIKQDWLRPCSRELVWTTKSRGTKQYSYRVKGIFWGLLKRGWKSYRAKRYVGMCIEKG